MSNMYNINELRTNKIAIQIPNKEQFSSIMSYCKTLGMIVLDNESWEVHKSDTCILFDHYNQVLGTSVEYHKNKDGYDVINLENVYEYNDYVKQNTSIEESNFLDYVDIRTSKFDSKFNIDDVVKYKGVADSSKLSGELIIIGIRTNERYIVALPECRGHKGYEYGFGSEPYKKHPRYEQYVNRSRCWNVDGEDLILVRKNSENKNIERKEEKTMTRENMIEKQITTSKKIVTNYFDKQSTNALNTRKETMSYITNDSNLAKFNKEVKELFNKEITELANTHLSYLVEDGEQITAYMSNTPCIELKDSKGILIPKLFSEKEKAQKNIAKETYNNSIRDIKELKDNILTAIDTFGEDVDSIRSLLVDQKIIDKKGLAL